MSYFGEEYTTENCGNCDNCLNPKEKVEAKEGAVKVLKVVKALDERFPTEYVISVLTGKLTPQIQMYRHDGLEVFASGNDEQEHYWNSLIRQLLLEGMLEKDIDISNVIAKDIMTVSPKTIQADEMAVNAMDALRKYDITQLVVLKDGKYAGIIHLHDLVREGLL